MGLSPEEENVFSVIVSQLARRRAGGISVPVVVISVLFVGIAAAVALLLGVHHHLVGLFYATFLVALVVGLSLTVFFDRRARPF